MISVVIPTRNRGDRIRPSLEAVVAAGRQASCPWELIVVDNGSTDDAAEVIAAFIRDHADLPITMVFEPRPGISAARNSGIAAARYPIIAFTDDDCLVDIGWFDAINAAFARDAECAIVGGRVQLHDPEDAPTSIRDFDDACVVSTLDQIRSRLIGCNVSIRRNLFDKIGLFDPRFGPPSAAASAEDHELFYRAQRSGFRLVYDPAVCIRHAHGRRGAAELAELGGRYIRGYGAVVGTYIRGGDSDLVKPAYYQLRELVLGRELHLLRHFAAGLAIGLLRRRRA